MPDHRTSGFFVLRTPLLPVAAHLRLGDGIDAAVIAAASEDESAFATALDRDRERGRQRLREALEDRVLRAAITLASPTMEEAIAAWEHDPEARRSRMTERALMRYVTRASGRPTPFGLFAGISVGRLGARTKLALPARERYQSHTHVSLAWATELAGALARQPELRDELIYRPNPTLYRLPGRRRYVARRPEEDYWVHAVREIRDGPVLSLALERAEAGATPAQLTELLVARDVASEAQAHGYVERLIDWQLLIADLAPPVTGGEPVSELLARLEEAPNGRAAAAALRDAQDAVEKLDGAGLGTAPENYSSLRARLQQVHEAPMGSQPLAVELHIPASDLTIGPALLDELARGVEVLRRWAPDPGADTLSGWREAFVERYEQREVPLIEAIDEDAGVGLGMLEEARATSVDVEQRDRLLFAKLEHALRCGDREILVGIDELDREPLPLPQSFVVGARIAAASAAAIDRGEFDLWLKSIRGPDAIGMFARFCHGNAALHEQVRAHMREEEALDPDAVHAEIAALPQLKLGVALHRPVLRDVEIDYLGPSGAPLDRRLRLEDLLVSVVDGRVLLRSRRDGRWVVPRLSSAINLDLLLPPAFRLLGFIERQDGMHLGWNWGALRWAPYHPRVRAGRTILAPARWRLGDTDLLPLQQGSDRERFRATADLRRRLELPRLVAVTDADNFLPVDLDTTVGIDMLLGLLRGREEAELLEVHPDPAQMCVEGPEGRFTNELIVPFLARVPIRRAPARPSADAMLRRSFPPGSEWLYVKLYGGAAAADSVVRDHVGPLCSRLVRDGVAKRWFFLRLADPHGHVRVRLNGDRAALRESALPLIGELAEELLERRLIWRSTLDTYEREIERYGGAAGIEFCEDFFFVDSEAAVAALVAEKRDAGSLVQRWRTALLAADAALAAFGIDLPAKVNAMRSARAQLARMLEPEVSASWSARSFAERYGERYRAERVELRRALDSARDGGGSPAIRGYGERAERFQGIARALLETHRDGRLSSSPVDIALDLVHMRINRLLRLGLREPELRLYDTLERLYYSELARERAAVGA